MSVVIPTETINRPFDENDSTAYADNTEQARIIAAVRRTEARIAVSRPSPGHPNAQGEGSGTVVTRDGIILTDRHCVTAADERTPLSDEQILVTVNGVQYHAHVLPDSHGLGIRSDQAALQIIPNTPGETFDAMRIASHVNPASNKYVFGYPQGSQNLFVSPVQNPGPQGDVVVPRNALTKAELQPGEDANRNLTESRVHIEPGNSGGAKVQIGADGQPELIEMSEITNTDVKSQKQAQQELDFYASKHLRDDETVQWSDAAGSHSDLYGRRRQFLEEVAHPTNAAWFTQRHDIVAFLDDVTGRKFGERGHTPDVLPPTQHWGGAWNDQASGRTDLTPTVRGRYETMADQILRAHSKPVENFALKQFMGDQGH